MSPALGLSTALSRRPISATQPALGIASWRHFPSAKEWRSWERQGLRYAEYLGHRHWLVELASGAEAAKPSLPQLSAASPLDP